MPKLKPSPSPSPFACLLGLAAVACGGGDEPTGEEACPLDDSMAIMPVYSNPYGELFELTDDGAPPLIPPPQGGYILCIAARVQVDVPAGCRLTVNAAVRAPGTNEVIGVEQRQIRMEMQADGWLWPREPAGLADLANVAVCPPPTATPVFDNPYELEVQLLDLDERPLTTTGATIRPICNSARCRTECAAPAGDT